MAKNAKYQRIMKKADSKKTKYEYKAEKARSKNIIDYEKVDKYEAKARKYGTKSKKAQSKLVYNKWAIKAIETREAAAKAKDKIEKNAKLMRVFNSTISAIDNGTIEQGKYFMRYVDD